MPDEIRERYETIRDIFVDVNYNESKGDIKIFCPYHLHHKKKLEINILKNNFHCWVCDRRGNIFKLLREFATQSQRMKYFKTLGLKYEEPLKKDDFFIELPKEYKFVSSYSSPIQRAAKRILVENLGLTEQTISLNMIGVCEDGPYKNRIIFPSFPIAPASQY